MPNPYPLSFLAALALSVPARSQSIGLVTDTATNRAILFDADSYQSLGSVGMPAHSDACYAYAVINSEGTLAYVSGFTAGIFVVDLTTRPPVAAAGINPIPLTWPSGQRMDISPDGRFLLISGLEMQSVDLLTRTQVGSWFIGGVAVGVNASLSGSVLVTVPSDLSLRRLILAPDGVLSDSGESLNVGQSSDVVLTPDRQFGVCLGSNLARSFLPSPLTLVESRPVNVAGKILANSECTRIYARGGSLLSVLAFDPSTGSSGSEGEFSVQLPSDACVISNPAFHPDGTRVFVPAGAELLVLDPHDGHLLGRVTDPHMAAPTSVSVRAGTGAF